MTRALAILSVTLWPAGVFAQNRRPAPAPPAPAPAPAASRPTVTAARYRVRIDPSADRFVVRAEFDVAPGADLVRLSLPAWSPGSYEIDNYARWVYGVRAEADGQPVFWDKEDKDTWRIGARGARRVAFELVTNPDSMMLEFSAVEPGFAFFNGTNLLVYPEGADLAALPAELTIEAPEGWRIATGLAQAGPGRYQAGNYHDLVDAPVFAGSRLWIDSVRVDGKPIRFVVQPDSAMSPAIWDSIALTLQRLATAQNRIFGGPPYDDYTVLFYAPFANMEWGGGLEHHNSQLDAIAAPFFASKTTGQLGDFTRPLISHEFFHLFNVKRIRPAEMWPYDYGREQFTPSLWWSEGVTDYYGDVTMTRGGLWSVDRFLRSMTSNISAVEEADEIVAVEDASINTWIHPVHVDEAQYYYPKGSLLGLMLDIRIREATRNRQSLDDVMRTLWTDWYQRGRGFTTEDLLGIIRPWFAGVDDFYNRFINGREPLPYAEILPRGGIAVAVTENKAPYIGVTAGEPAQGGVTVTAVEPGSPAAEAGLAIGDVLLAAGDVRADNPALLGPAYRRRYAAGEGQAIVFMFRRGGRDMTGRATVKLRTSRTYRLTRDPAAAGEARAILDGILGQER